MYLDYEQEPTKWLLYVISGTIGGLFFTTLMLLPGGLITALLAWTIQHPSPWRILSSIILFGGYVAASDFYEWE